MAICGLVTVGDRLFFYFVQAVIILPFASVRFLEESTKQGISANSSSGIAHLLPL